MNKIEKTFYLVEKNLEKMGFDVDGYMSGFMATSSGYLTFRPSENDDLIKIRISDHNLPPSYGNKHGYADYEIGAHGDAYDDWFVVLKMIAEKLNCELPASVKSLLTKKEKNDAIQAEKNKAYEVKIEMQFQKKKEENEKIEAVMIAKGYSDLTGKARKRKRQKIKKALGL